MDGSKTKTNDLYYNYGSQKYLSKMAVPFHSYETSTIPATHVFLNTVASAVEHEEAKSAKPALTA